MEKTNKKIKDSDVFRITAKGKITVSSKKEIYNFVLELIKECYPLMNKRKLVKYLNNKEGDKFLGDCLEDLKLVKFVEETKK